MPITSSAKKALRQSITHKKQNTLRREAYKDAVKNYKKLLDAKKSDEAKAALVQVYKTLDKAAKTNAISRQKASRLKSRLSIKLAPPAPRTPSSA